MVGGFNRTFEMTHFRLELGKNVHHGSMNLVWSWCVKGETSKQLLP